MTDLTFWIFHCKQGPSPVGPLDSPVGPLSIFGSFMPVCRCQSCPHTCDVCTSLSVFICISKFFLTPAPLTSEISLYILFHVGKKIYFLKVATLTSADIDGKQPHQRSLSTAEAWNVGCTALHLIPYYSSDGAAAGRLKKGVCAMAAPFPCVCVVRVCAYIFCPFVAHPQCSLRSCIQIIITM